MDGEKLKRSLLFRFGGGRFFDDSDSNWVFGKNCAVARAGRRGRGRGLAWRFLENLCRAKTSALGAYATARPTEEAQSVLDNVGTIERIRRPAISLG